MSSSHTRVVKGYLKNRPHNLLTAYTQDKGVSKSDVVNEAVTEYFERMPASERLRLLEIAQNKVGK